VTENWQQFFAIGAAYIVWNGYKRLRQDCDCSFPEGLKCVVVEAE